MGYIKLIHWDEILYIWENYLWSDRTTAITKNSAMCYLGGHDASNMQTPPTFIGYFDSQDKLVGVNSGHKTDKNNYRSRGLWVDENNRRRGIGVQLLLSIETQAKIEGCDMIWSYPRQTSWNTYLKAGFTLSSHWVQSDTSPANAYCYKKISW